MGSILFGKQKNKIASGLVWALMILGMSQLADIAEYYGQTEIQNMFLTIVATPAIAALCFGLFRVIIPVHRPKEILAEVEEKSSLGLLAVHGYDNQTHYINLDNDPALILKGLKEIGYQDYGFWKEINLRFCRAPFKGDNRYSGIRILSFENMRRTKEPQEI